MQDGAQERKNASRLECVECAKVKRQENVLNNLGKARSRKKNKQRRTKYAKKEKIETASGVLVTCPAGRRI